MTVNKKLRALFEMYITRKIGAEIKCCLTFMLILCYYGVYRLWCGLETAELIHMLEMLWAAYTLEWVQVLVHCDFDEVDRLSVKEWVMMLAGSGIYSLTGHTAGWFDGNMTVTAGFAAYMLICYLCTFWVYAIKRTIDAKMLNDDLKKFQERNIGK